MLYLIATPIGNLEDFSFRSVKTLLLCDYILCEDTRKSLCLLKHYKIEKPIKPFHQFNEKKKEKKVLEDIKKGLNIALISDAGMPTISDPGIDLIKKCIEKDLPFTVIPGASSILNALVLSGMPNEPFQFVGFIPKKEKEKEKFLKKILCYEGISISFESPHRLIKTLLILNEISIPSCSYPFSSVSSSSCSLSSSLSSISSCSIVICREMTKKFEEIFRGTPAEGIEHFQKKVLKGEIVLLIQGKMTKKSYSLNDLLSLLQKEGLSKKSATKIASKILKLPKKTIYKKIMGE